MLDRFLPSLLEFVPAAEVTVVDDASQDATGSVCARYGIRCLAHEKNQGKGAALKTGFSHLLAQKKDWIITMDADGQHAPSDLNAFILESRRTPPPGLIIGARAMRTGSMPLARIFSNTLTSAYLSFITRRRIKDSQCGFRMYSAQLLSQIAITYQRFEMESEVIIKTVLAGFDISFVDVQTLYCSEGSHISHLRDTIRWIKAVTSISHKVNS
jgi:glycosyltransferase involved in cell wall biosynthesis